MHFILCTRPYLNFYFAAPTEPPQSFVAALEFSTNITVEWQRVRCSERRSEITHYFLQYMLEGCDGVTEMRVSGTSDKSRKYTATRLQPLSRYTFTIAAVNSDEQMGPNATIIAMTSAPESMFIIIIIIIIVLTF